jgi:hypothetical protein
MKAIIYWIHKNCRFAMPQELLEQEMRTNNAEREAFESYDQAMALIKQVREKPKGLILTPEEEEAIKRKQFDDARMKRQNEEYDATVKRQNAAIAAAFEEKKRKLQIEEARIERIVNKILKAKEFNQKYKINQPKTKDLIQRKYPNLIPYIV